VLHDYLVSYRVVELSPALYFLRLGLREYRPYYADRFVPIGQSLAPVLGPSRFGAQDGKLPEFLSRHQHYVPRKYRAHLLLCEHFPERECSRSREHRASVVVHAGMKVWRLFLRLFVHRGDAGVRQYFVTQLLVQFLP
jgi:hypothetical protein